MTHRSLQQLRSLPLLLIVLFSSTLWAQTPPTKTDKPILKVPAPLVQGFPQPKSFAELQKRDRTIERALWDKARDDLKSDPKKLASFYASWWKFERVGLFDVGTKIAQIHSRLGDPDQKSSTSWLYGPMAIDIKNDRVQAIRYRLSDVPPRRYSFDVTLPGKWLVRNRIQFATHEYEGSVPQQPDPTRSQYLAYSRVLGRGKDAAALSQVSRMATTVILRGSASSQRQVLKENDRELFLQLSLTRRPIRIGLLPNAPQTAPTQLEHGIALMRLVRDGQDVHILEFTTFAHDPLPQEKLTKLIDSIGAAKLKKLPVAASATR